MRDAVHLAVLQPETVARPEDRFRCEPYSAIIPARTCLARRGAEYVGGRSQHAAPERHAAFPVCAQCPLGLVIASRVASVAAPQGCAVPGCKMLARRGVYCVRHARSAVTGRIAPPRGGDRG